MQSLSTFTNWQASAIDRCQVGCQASKDVAGLQEELSDNTSLNDEIAERNADLRFLEMAAERFNAAAKVFAICLMIFLFVFLI